MTDSSTKMEKSSKPQQFLKQLKRMELHIQQKYPFPIGDAKQLTQVGYYSDGDTSWVNEVGLELTNAQKVEVTKIH